MSCKKEVYLVETITCAKVCEKFNENPIPSFRFDSYRLIDNSEYFDSENLFMRQIKWEVYSEDVLLYDFGYGYFTDPINELGNASTYGSINLGLNNSDIINFLNSLEFTEIEDDVDLKILISVKDDSGVESLEESNIYYFTK